MSPLLRHSYRHCYRVARRAASNFYWSFFLLPPAKRRAMCALYAFMRHTDDLSDCDAPQDERRKELAAWRAALDEALTHETDHRLLLAVVDTVQRFGIPHEYLFDVIAGVERDLAPSDFRCFDDLRQYCYLVASSVGLACIHIWGFVGDEPRGPAIECGVAFQMTNILRDLDEDARRGRVYLPREDFERAGYSPEDLRNRVVDDRFRVLLRIEVERTERFYCEAAELLPHLRRDGRRILRMMIATYRALLDEIKRRDGDLFSRPVQLTRRQKMSALAAALVGRSN